MALIAYVREFHSDLQMVLGEETYGGCGGGVRVLAADL